MSPRAPNSTPGRETEKVFTRGPVGGASVPLGLTVSKQGNISFETSTADPDTMALFLWCQNVLGYERFKGENSKGLEKAGTTGHCDVPVCRAFPDEVDQWLQAVPCPG